MNRQLLINSYACAFKLGYKINMNHDQPCLTYIKADRTYVLKNKGQCNLLETVLIGAEDCTGDWLLDVAIRLDTSRSFVEGFINGLNFKIKPEDKPT